MTGGFNACGIPESLLEALVKKDVKNLTVITLTCGMDDVGIGLLFKNR